MNARILALVIYLLFPASSVIAQGFPFVIPGDDARDTVTSRRSLLHAPAGKNGFVRTEGEHFYVGDERIRFWGVNLCFPANFPTHQDADRIAPHLAKLGVNAVRFHHMDNQNAPRGIWSSQLEGGRRVFDPEMVDRLDYFLAKLHEHGIYADLNLHCSRELSEAEGYPKLDGAPWWAASNKWVMYYDADVQSKVKQYCRDLLTHRNPYRDGLARVDDPGIGLIEMLNENYFSVKGYALYRKLPERFQKSFIAAWNRWLINRYQNTAKMKQAWQNGQPALQDELADSSSWDRSLGDWVISLDEDAIARQFGATTSVPDGNQGEVPSAPAIRLQPSGVTTNDYEQQLRYADLSVTKDQPYTLTYWVRVDQTRGYRAELSTDVGSNWRDLGIFESLKATPQWRKVTRIIFPQETILGDATLKLNFGRSTVPIEFAGVSLRPGAETRSLPDAQKLESLSVAIPDALSPVAAHRDMKQFMVDTEIAWVQELKRFLTDDLGVRVPIMASQVNYHTPEINVKYNDFVDLHNYWHHPMFPSDAQWDPRQWTVGNEPMEASPMRADWPTNSLLTRTGWRHAGKPMTLTEWNYPEPSPYSSGAVSMAAAIAALQDWDAVFFFDYDSNSVDSQSWFRDQTVNFFSFNGQPVKLASLSVFANVFARGDLAPLKQQRLAPIDSPIEGAHALRFRLGVSDTVTQAPSLGDVDTTALTTPDGRLKWESDGTQGRLVIDTRRTQGAWGTIGETSFETKSMDAKVHGLSPNYGTLVLTSQSNAPIETSHKLLLLASTHSENQEMRWNDNRDSVGQNWGSGPTSVLGMEAEISLKCQKVDRVFVLDGQGRRLDEVPVQRSDDRITFRISPEYETLWYELAPKKKPPRPFRWVNEFPKTHSTSLRHATMASRIAGQEVGYVVLLPRGYDTSQQRYPVVYYLHGGRPGDETKSIRLADQMIRLQDDHEVTPTIYVFVNGGPVSHYNVPDQIGITGKPDAVGADVFIKELIPHIDTHYRTIPDRDHRGLEGFSQGGRGTMRLALRYPELFSSVAAGGGGYATEKRISESPDSAESATLRFASGDNTWDLARRYAERADAPELNLLIYVGTKGFNYENNLEYSEFLSQLGIKHRSLVVPGVPHSATWIYEEAGLEIMRFHEANFAP
ncbi:MAG: alpha/beta hydrolase-fold protein [Planctomycetota bacterium]